MHQEVTVKARRRFLGAVLAAVATLSPRVPEAAAVSTGAHELPSGAKKTAPPPPEARGIIKERNDLFMLAALSYVYTHRQESPCTGYDIATLVAWNVENTSETPAFVIDRNRTREKLATVFHSELNAILLAFQARNAEDGPSSELRRRTYHDLLAKGRLYTTLEPCPMCEGAILLARIPAVTYCLDDPGLRDPASRDYKVPPARAAYDRSFTQERALLPLCDASNEALWHDIRAGGSPKRFSVTQYFKQRMDVIFKPAYGQLSNYKVAHTENRALWQVLKKEAATDGKGSRTCTTAAEAR